jgi:CTP synthase (UTP-ammonia lyase)
MRGAEHQETAPEASQLLITRLACSLVGQTQAIQVVPGTRAYQAYGTVAVEQFRCNYGLNPAYRDSLFGGALRIAGTDPEGEVRIVELTGHPFFVATLFLPQLASSPERPHPLILAYLQAALGDG